MATELAVKLSAEQAARLQEYAHRLGYVASDVAASLVEEALRALEFEFIEFRDSPAGRQAYVSGTGLAVWEVVMVARGYDGDAEQARRHLSLLPGRVEAALRYAAAFTDEIEAALADNESYTPQDPTTWGSRTKSLIGASLTFSRR